MKYFPATKFSMRTINNLIKRLYSSTFFERLEKNNQNFFHISNDEINVIVAVEPDKKSLNIFYKEEGFITFESMIRDDARNFFAYANNYIVIEPRDIYEYPFLNCEKIIKDFPLYHIDSIPVTYLSYHRGRTEMPITEKEALLVVDVLQYLLVIRDLYKNNKEKPAPKKDMVADFIFNDIDYTYNLEYIDLQVLSFIPMIRFQAKKDPNFVLWLKEKEVMPGQLYLGCFNTAVINETYKLKNGFEYSKTPMLLYACTDNKTIDYIMFDVDDSTFKKNLKGELLNIIDKVGLFDSIITDNYMVYLLIYKELQELGINIQFDLMNIVNNFVFKALRPILFCRDMQQFNEYLKCFIEDYPNVIEDIISNNIDFDDDEFDEYEDDYKEDDNKNIVS